MVTKEQMQQNKEEVIKLLRSTNREGIESLIDHLVNSDYFYAPASSHFHGCYEGGLCDHSLHVYHIMHSLVRDAMKNDEIKEDSIIISALCHDLAKINFYEQYDKNVKVDGQWVQEKHYRVIGAENRFVYGTHEMTSEFIARQFIPLSIEESSSILCHHGGIGNGNTPIDVVAEVYGAYKLAIYLHTADLMSSFVYNI